MYYRGTDCMQTRRFCGDFGCLVVTMAICAKWLNRSIWVCLKIREPSQYPYEMLLSLKARSWPPSWSRQNAKMHQNKQISKLTLLPQIPLRIYALSYWSWPLFLILLTDILALWRSRLSARMSTIKNSAGVRPVWRWTLRTAAIWNSWR